MKRSLVAFIVLIALALGVFTASSAYTAAQAGKLSLERETFYGDAAAAEGFAVDVDAAIEQHAVLNARLSLTTGEQKAARSWSTKQVNYYDSETSVIMELAGASLSSGFSWSGSSEMSWWRQEENSIEAKLYDSIASKVDVGETKTELVCLNDFTDHLPLQFYTSRVNTDGHSNMADVFRVPLRDEVLLELTLTRQADGGDFTINELKPEDFWCSSSGIMAADGNIYMAMLITDKNGAQLDASELPGGSWGVYRIPCEQPEDGERSGARWWMNVDTQVTAIPERSELITPAGEDCTALKMFLSYDGQYLLLFTCEGGEIYLYVIDITSGATLSREKLPVPDDADVEELQNRIYSISCTLYEDLAVFRLGWYAYVYTPCAGEYELKLCARAYDQPRPSKYDPDHYSIGSDEYEYAYDGERLAVIDYGTLYYWDDMQEQQRNGYARLCVYGEDGELLCADWIGSQLYSWMNSASVQVKYDVECE